MLFFLFLTAALFFFAELRRSFGYFSPRLLFYNYKYDRISPTIGAHILINQLRKNEVAPYVRLSATNFSSQDGIGFGLLLDSFSISLVSASPNSEVCSYKYHFFNYFTKIFFIFFTISTFDNNSLTFSSPVRISPTSSNFDFKFNSIVFIVNSKLFVRLKFCFITEGVAEWSKATDCKSVQ